LRDKGEQTRGRKRRQSKPQIAHADPPWHPS
jgi:hypothetical protein